MKISDAQYNSAEPPLPERPKKEKTPKKTPTKDESQILFCFPLSCFALPCFLKVLSVVAWLTFVC